MLGLRNACYRFLEQVGVPPESNVTIYCTVVLILFHPSFRVSDFGFILLLILHFSRGLQDTPEYPLDTPTLVRRSFWVCPHGCRSMILFNWRPTNTSHIWYHSQLANPAALPYGVIRDTLVVGNWSHSEKLQSKRFRNATHLQSSSLQCLA